MIIKIIYTTYNDPEYGLCVKQYLYIRIIYFTMITLSGQFWIQIQWQIYDLGRHFCIMFCELLSLTVISTNWCGESEIWHRSFTRKIISIFPFLTKTIYHVTPFSRYEFISWQNGFFGQILMKPSLDQNFRSFQF